MIHIWLKGKPREDIEIPQKEPTPVLLSDTTIEKALKEAKDSGMFDGPPGKPGEPGKPGPSYDDSEIREQIAEKVGFNDVASTSKSGVINRIFADGTYGIGMNAAAGLYVAGASVSDINGRQQGNRPIVPTRLDYAVKAALTDGKGPEYSEAEKTAAKKRIGVDETERSLEALWKLNRGQTWDFEEKAESGMNIAPSGAQWMTLENVEGKTEQFSTNGYQLIPFPFTYGSRTVNGVEFLVNDDQSVTIKGTATANYYFYLVDGDKDVLADGEYTVSASGLVSGVTVQGWNDWDKFYTNYSLNLDANRNKSSGTVNANSKRYRICICVTSGTAVDTTVSVMIEKGSTAHPWEPYTGGIPAPSPEYPQEIHSVERIEVKKIGRNFWDEEWEIGTIGSSNGLNGGGITTIRFKNYIPIDDRKRYKFVAPEIMKATNIRSRFYDENKNYIGYVGDNGIALNWSSSFVPPVGAKYIRVEINEKYGTVYNHDIALVLNEDVGGYEPYIEPVSRTIIPPRPLNKIGEYADLCNVASGEWEWRIANTPIAGKTFTFLNDAVYSLNALINRVDVRSPLVCNNLKYTGGASNVSEAKSKGYGISTYSPETVPNLERIQIFLPDAHSLSDYINSIKDSVVYYVSDESHEPIAADDLAFLRSLENLPADQHIVITDQDGNDVSYLLEYLVKLNEVNT